MTLKKLFFLVFLIIFGSDILVICQIHTGWFGIPSVSDLSDCARDFKAFSGNPHPDTGLAADEIIKKYGYPLQKVNVVTEDGYILQVLRIPHGRAEISRFVPGERRKPVYVAHGFFCNAQAWLIQPYSRNLAFLLADSGFDVFLASARGTRYSQTHIDPTMGPTTKKYWDFSHHEMGIYDVPAIIDAIIDLTGFSKIYYVGHSMGGTQLITGAAERPEINDKISAAFLMAPGGSLYNAKSFLRFLLPALYNLQEAGNFVLGGRIDQIQKLFDFIGIPLSYLCAPSALACGACGTIMYFLFGYDAPQTNYTAIPLLTNFFPATMATKTAIHLGQGSVTNRMLQFDYGSAERNRKRYGQPNPPMYNLSRITLPIVIYYGHSDNLVTPEDTKQLAAWIGKPAIKEVNEVPWKLFNHADFLQAKDADDLLYKDIRDKIKSGLYG